MSLEPMQIEEATIAGIQEAMRTGKITARSLVDSYLARIAAYDQHGPAINAVVSINSGARDRADELDASLSSTGELSGSLHGIPMLVKDCIETVDMPTSFGSVAFADYRPTNDATVVRNLREAGAVVLGKTSLPDFAFSWWAYSSRTGETKNPYALDRDPGGSSSGTGASIASNFATVGLGTDCGGSIRVPASFDNLVGVRSTPGLVSRNGVGCLLFFQDTIGPMARTVVDAATVMDVLVGYDDADSLTAAYVVARAPKRYTELLMADGLRGARIGLVKNALGSDADPYAAPVNKVVTNAIDAIRNAGAEVIELEIPDLAHHIDATSLYVTSSKQDINTFLAARPNAPMKTLQEIYESKQYHPRLDLLEACATGPDQAVDDPEYYPRFAAREVFTRTVINVMAQHRVEALTFPSVQVIPPLHKLLDQGVWSTLTFPTNTLIASQTGMPAITVPAGYANGELPVGLEFVGLPYDEPTLFRLAYGFEQATRQRRPPATTPELSN